MFASALSFLLLAFGVSVESLSSHSWIQSSVDGTRIECPMKFEFKGNKYRLYNPCPTKSRSGVIEFGTYRVDQNKLQFSDRFVLEGGGSIFGEDAQPFELVIEEMSETSILFRYQDERIQVVSNGAPNW